MALLALVNFPKITKQGVTHPASNPPSRDKIKGIVGGYPKNHIGLKQEQKWGKCKYNLDDLCKRIYVFF